MGLVGKDLTDEEKSSTKVEIEWVLLGWKRRQLTRESTKVEIEWVLLGSLGSYLPIDLQK